ncbi:hypothetical protein [Microbacterium sp. JZ31]|uniref:hypothetical protein n=1 Tax=Microbacterium sp. JZ31 TaxID=1906274 RepID=UPI0019336CA8|nr:hypothetical protein [Microbacterium sp. JZ31]
MGKFKPIFDSLSEAALRGARHADAKLPQLARNHGDQLDDWVRRVRGEDRFDDKPDTPTKPDTVEPQESQARPGFNADGTVNPEDFRTRRDGAFYWSGMWPRDGQAIAGRIAADNHGTTLEMLIESRRIEMPEWNADDPAVVETWTRVSEAYANGASGVVRAVLGDGIRPNAVWWAELERLKANPDVTQVIRIHPDTLEETVVWPT